MDSNLNTFPQTSVYDFNPNDNELKLANRYFPNFDRYLRIEKHCYSSGSPIGLGWDKPVPLPKFQGVILNISKNVKTNGYVIKFRNSEREIIELNAQIIIFACGTLMNAALVSLLTGEKKFPIGNHATFELGKIQYKQLQSLGNIIQNYSIKSKNFFSFTFPKSRQSQKNNYPEVSVRLNYANKFSFKEVFLRNFEIRLIKTYLKRVILEKLFHKHFYSDLIITAWVEIPLNVKNFIYIENFINGKFKMHVHIKKTSECIAQVNVIKIIIQDLLLSSGIEKQTSFISDNRVSVQPWQDAAHYFGTVPMLDTQYSQEFNLTYTPKTISKNFELNGSPNVYVVGNSAVPQGGHGHPTLLAVSAAQTFVNRYLQNLNSTSESEFSS